MNIDLIAFDADDTLWHTEILYTGAQEKFKQLLSRYHSPEWIEQKLYETEMRNLDHFGYGIKAFVLSMIETAVELTEGRIEGAEVGQIMGYGKEMLGAEVRLLEQVEATVSALAQRYDLMILTKGDLLDQEGKIARSGLAGYFKHVEVISSKSPAVYQAILRRHRLAPERFVMVGNSIKSDILPVLAMGGAGVYIPYEVTWAHEHEVEPAADTPGYYRLANMGELPGLIAALEEKKD